MRLLSFALLVLAIFAIPPANGSLVSYRDVLVAEWNEFKQEHGKKYTDETEEKFRMKIFLENKHKIARHNQASNGERAYSLGMNQFGDLLHHEFVKLMNGYDNSSRRTSKSNDDDDNRIPIFLAPENFELPSAVDWREKGLVTSVKNQGHCGSCWSFSATGALEAQNMRRTGKLVSLSEQNLIDCSKKFGNNGCNGGLMDNAFSFIKSNGGIDTEQSYPYEARDDKCRFQKSAIGAKDTGFIDIPAGSETHLAKAVASVGPVSVAIDASHESFQFYKKGIYDERSCSSVDLDHGVLVVGYGVDPKGHHYWIVKNSWGEKWGHDGYIYMSKDKDNQCGIASAASYPLV